MECDRWDVRLRIDVDGGQGFRFVHRGMTDPQVSEVCRRVALWARLPDGAAAGMGVDAWPSPIEEDPFICIAFNPATGEIQVSFGGLTRFEVAMNCQGVADYISALIFAPHTLAPLKSMYGVTNGTIFDTGK